MRFFYLIILGLIAPVFSFGQDIIVLKSNETELKCNIISTSDTSITYTLYDSADDSEHVIAKSAVLSFFIDSNNEASSNSNTKSGLLGKYYSGTQMSGYVILNNGDSLTGMITITNVAMNQLEVVMTDNTGNTKKYPVKEVKRYGYGELLYERMNPDMKAEITNGRTVKHEELLLHCEVSGPASIYRMYTLTFNTGQIKSETPPPHYLGKLHMYYVIRHPSGTVISSKNRTYKGMINRIFNDNKEIKNEVYNTGVSEEKLLDIVRNYNAWYLKK